MKKIYLIVAFYAFMLTSCVQHMEESLESPLHGTWVEISSVHSVSKYVNFDGGYMSIHNADAFGCYVDGTVWGLSDPVFSSNTRYEVSDGVIYSGVKSYPFTIKDDILIFDGRPYKNVESFNSQKYSKIVMGDSNKTELSYRSAQVEWTYQIANPIDGLNLTVKSAPTWVGSVDGVNVSDGKITFTTEAAQANRSGEIVLSYETADDVRIKISQVPTSTIFIANSTYTYTYAASSKTILCDISGLTIDEMRVECDVDWVSDISFDGSLNFKLSENNTGDSRMGEITLTHPEARPVKIHIVQSYSASSIVLNKSSHSPDYVGGNFEFTYSVSNPREGQKATVSTSDSWITGVTDSNGTVSYKVSKNTAGSSRSGKIIVKYGDLSKTYTITQSAASLTLSSSSASCTYASVSKSFSITISNRQSDLAVSVKSDVTWITGVSESNGTVSYTVTENNSGSSRTGKITVTYAGVSKELAVTQSYAAPSISLSSTSSSHDYVSGTYTFKYTVTNPREGQSLSATTQADWITDVTISDSNVTYRVSENNSGSSRTGSIVLTYSGVNKEVTVSQVQKPVDLSAPATANCYIVSGAGPYYFKPVKGNSSTSVGTISSVAVLWESFGTSTTPSKGDLIKSVSYKDGNIYFDTATTFKEGNAVIAAKNSSGTILWSWHIWFTDQPQGQEYYNNAGTMMDRNLGATSATPGDVGALGLLYQWGRKDPFLGSSSISRSVIAKSTITWPSDVESNSSNGTIAYAISHPTTFITRDDNNYDWHYTGNESTDNTRWTTSDKAKSIYDPCPAGWRVPDGGSNGVWSKALGSSLSFEYTYDSTNEGRNFSGKFGSASSIWYPASGYRNNYSANLNSTGSYGYYYAVQADATAYNSNHCVLDLKDSWNNDHVDPKGYEFKASGCSVRCIKE